MTSSLATVSYIGATILFILSLGGLANPETARRGNVFGIIGMTIAVLVMRMGTIAGEVDGAAITEENIVRLAMGLEREEEPA